MKLERLPKVRLTPNNKHKFRQPSDYHAQVVTDPRFNHALRRDAFANVPNASTLYASLLRPTT